MFAAIRPIAIAACFPLVTLSTLASAVAWVFVVSV
jgi:hypothetical protein